MKSQKSTNAMLRELRPALLGAGAVALAGLGLIAQGASVYYNGAAERRDDVSAMMQTGRQVSELERDRRLAHAFDGRFTGWRDIGAIGVFDKAREIDVFEATIRGQAAPVRSYALGAFTPVPVSYNLPTSRYVLGRHELVFDALPLHEGQIIDLLGALQRGLGGLSIIEGCSVQRPVGEAGTGASPDEGIARLRMRCSVNWYVFSDTQSSAGAAAAGAPGIAMPAMETSYGRSGS